MNIELNNQDLEDHLKTLTPGEKLSMVDGLISEKKWDIQGLSIALRANVSLSEDLLNFIEFLQISKDNGH